MASLNAIVSQGPLAEVNHATRPPGLLWKAARILAESGSLKTPFVAGKSEKAATLPKCFLFGSLAGMSPH